MELDTCFKNDMKEHINYYNQSISMGLYSFHFTLFRTVLYTIVYNIDDFEYMKLMFASVLILIINELLYPKSFKCFQTFSILPTFYIFQCNYMPTNNELKRFKPFFLVSKLARMYACRPQMWYTPFIPNLHSFTEQTTHQSINYV